MDGNLPNDNRFNPAILKRLVELNIDDYHEAMLYLLAVYYNLETKTISEETIRTVNFTNIIERVYATTPHTIKWNIPLFNDLSQEEKGADYWVWVEEYRELWTPAGIKFKGDTKGTVKKMKILFQERPDIRKEEVFAAARLYLEEFRTGKTPMTYLQRADYFISKDKKEGGRTITESRLQTYIEHVRVIQGTDTTTSGGMRRLIQ
jgi:hypothetical protein